MTVRTAVVCGLMAALGLVPAIVHGGEVYTLPFIATPNAPGGARGVMQIRVKEGKSLVTLHVRGLYPETVYTIWTVFNHLAPGMAKSTNHAPPSCSANGTASNSLCPSGWTGWLDFHREGNGVAPTAKVSSRFTDGMGLDPGSTFVTNSHGDGKVVVALDFDITSEAPIGNKDIIVQCAPTPGVILKVVDVATGKTEQACADPGSKLLRVTTTWLREFIGQTPKAHRASTCANYEPSMDPDNFDPVTQKGDYEHALANDARLWQCVDPRTGLPRVPRHGFDHFRLANHPDDLTHGFIGGNGTDHWIDMVGLRACAVPPLPQLQAAGGATIDYTCPTKD